MPRFARITEQPDMPADHGAPSPIATLLASIADPAVELDSEGRITAWNEAAAARFGLHDADRGARPEERLRRWQGGARRVALADGDHAMVVWSLDEDGLGPDEIALSKAEVVGRTSGSALHEINNQLNLGIGLGGLIPMEPGLPPDLLDMAGNLEAYGQHAHELAQGFLEFTRTRPQETTTFRVGPMVRQLFDVLAHTAINMEGRVTAPDTLPEITGDAALLRHALFALFVNALEAQGASWTPGSKGVQGRFIVTASHRDDGRGNRIRIAIEDAALPVPEAERDGLFTGGAARSTRDLIVARVLIGRLGGRVSHEAAPQGNRLVVDLPVAGTTLPEVAQDVVGPPVILLCDEDAFIRALLTRMMDRRKFRTVEARSGHDAIAIASSQHVDFVIADGKVPDLPAAALYDGLIAARASLASRIVLLTADPTDAELAELQARTGVPTLPKPFDTARLDELLKAAFEA